jgi:hypothetical protein
MISVNRQFIILVVLCLFMGNPVVAGTYYMAGAPKLSAYISDTNEFSPGTDATLTIVIENSGLNEFKFNQSSILERDDLPNTAKLLVVSLLSGDSPLIIKSDPQMVGDLKGGSTVKSTFNTRINSDAPAGTYNLPLNLKYTYLAQVEQYGVDTVRYYYKEKDEILTVPVKIKSEISIDVLSAEPEHLNVGTEGYLNLKIKNTGSEDGEKAIVKIIRNGESPILPTDSSVYIGEFPAGSTVSCRYKVLVATGAERSTYPVDVTVVYENKDGDTVSSRSDTVGVPVGGKIDFEIISPPMEIFLGTKKVITVAYKNTGDSTVYSAQGRISAVDPFTSNDDIAYLGDIRSGESVIASYEITVAKDATIKEYGLDSEIRYRDALDNTYISDIMKVRVNVIAQSGISAILSNPIMMSIIIAAIIGVGFGIYKYRRKRD